MIQRIQSIYLALVLLLSLLLFRGALLNFSDGAKLMLNGLITDQAGQTIGKTANILPLTIFLFLIASLSIAAIFLYKKRKIQLILVKVLVALAVIFIGALCWYGYSVATTQKSAIIPGIKLVVPILILLFSILALRGIQSDDRLVKSYDRLR